MSVLSKPLDVNSLLRSNMIFIKLACIGAGFPNTANGPLITNVVLLSILKSS